MVHVGIMTMKVETIIRLVDESCYTREQKNVFTRIFLDFQGKKFDSIKEMTSEFNALKVVERKAFLKELNGKVVNICENFI